MSVQPVVDALKAFMGDPADLRLRSVQLPGVSEAEGVIIYLESIVDLSEVTQKLINPLSAMVSREVRECGPIPLREQPALREMAMYGRGVKQDSKALAQSLFEGHTLLIIAGVQHALAVNTAKWNNRSVTEPERESTLIGPKDTFIEDVYVNLSMIRRRIRHVSLQVEERVIGTASQTKLMIVSMKGMVNGKALDEFKQRLAQIRIDHVLDTTQIGQIVVGAKINPFPMYQLTERPDKSVSALLEGRFLVIMDTTPTVLILPATMTCLYETPDDYYFSSLAGTFLRMMRLIGLAITLFLPSLYIAITSVNQDMFRIQFMLAVAASREGVPYPAYVEVVIMLILIELINEATVRLPKTIGGTATIVGGLIIGTAAAQSHLISYIMIVVTATTAIGSYTAPNYVVGLAWRICSFGLMALSVPWGLYGIVVGAGFIGLYLCLLESLGVPYTAPFGTFRYRDLLRDALVRAPRWMANLRPSTYSRSAAGKQRMSTEGEDGY